MLGWDLSARNKTKRAARQKQKEKRVSGWERFSDLVKLYRSEICLCAGLIVGILLVFSQVAGFSFLHYDDDANVYNNPNVKQGFSLHALKWAFTAMRPDYWRPIIWLSHLLDVQLFGLNPAGHHWTNLLIHTVNVLLLFVILRRITGAVWRSAAVAALFAIHPLRAESVAWVTERKDVLSGMFWWLTTWAYVEYAKDSGSRKRYWLVIGVFVLALMAKPTVMALPFFLLLIDYWPLRRLELTRTATLTLIREKLPLFLLAAVSMLVTARSQRELGTLEIIPNLSFPLRLANAVIAYATYLYNALWPVNLIAIYPYNRHPAAWEILASVLLLAGVTLLVLWKAGCRPYLAVGWFWYLGVLLPLVGLVQMGFQARADRFTYIPLVGIFVLAVWGLHDLMCQWRHARTAAIALAVFVFPALGVRASSQVSYWRDTITLFRENVRVTPDNQWALGLLGAELINAGSTQEGLNYLSRAVRLDPGNWFAHNNLGKALYYLHRPNEAIISFRQSLHLKPDFAEAYDNLGKVLVDERRWEEAVAIYSELVRLMPDAAGAYYDRGIGLLEIGRLEEARHDFERALNLAPPPPMASLCEADLGQIAVRRGNTGEALPHFFKALRLDPDSLAVRKSLFEAIVKMGPTDAAIQSLRSLLSVTPDSDIQKYLNALLAQRAK
jgi:tetratricopeptide (TPR) repeat protein